MVLIHAVEEVIILFEYGNTYYEQLDGLRNEQENMQVLA